MIPSLPCAVSPAVEPVSLLSRNSATSPSDGAVSAEYSAATSLAPNALFHIRKREIPLSKKLLPSLVPSRRGDIPAVGSTSSWRLSLGGGW